MNNDRQHKRGCLGVLFGMFSVSGRAPSEDSLPYRLRDDFLSPAEHSFYRVLCGFVAERFVVCPKVNVADILFVVRPNENIVARNQIDRKHVDFLLCDPSTMQPVGAIELDDASHDRQDRRARDAFLNKAFAAAKLPLVHVPAKSGYSYTELAALLSPVLSGQSPRATDQPTIADVGKTAPPVCPKCSEPMVRRVAKRGDEIGKAFWGCPNFPRCREVINT